MIVTYVVSLSLLGLSGVMLDLHRRRWHGAEQDSKLPPNERRYALSQYRRRMQASGIIGALGVAIGCWPLVPREPLSITLYLLSIAGACLAITLLAALDAWATRQHFARVQSQHVAASVKLARDLRRDAGAAEDLAEPSRK
jgi:hypothetical protein